MIIFNCLTKEAITKILDKIIKEIEERLKYSNIHINLTDQSKNYLIEEGYNEIYGARPLKRLVTSTIETSLAKELINGNIKPNDNITFDYKDDKIYIRK